VPKPVRNFAFIDSQNIHLGVQALGWKLDWRKFRIYLRDKYSVAKAYLFIGYLPEGQRLYTRLQHYGYVLVFKPVLQKEVGGPKGNVDADLVLRAMIDYPNYAGAVVVTSDGDFYSLVDYLYQKGKLEVVLSPSTGTCSALLKKSARERIHFLVTLRSKLEYAPKNKK
jgi:uncharacterized LabA/DUF88 family protein